MRRERVSDDVYVFTSDIFAQVTSSAIVTTDGIVVVDTLPFPEETEAILKFLRDLNSGPIRYLINSHWHSDHTNGNFMFDSDIQLISHRLCYNFLEEYGPRMLAEAKQETPELEPVHLRMPDLIFDEGPMVIHLGEKSIELTLTPGHTPDSICCYIREDKILIAGDTIMPVPHFIWGNREDYINSLKKMQTWSLESIVQGHGEVLLRGEIPEYINSHIAYMERIQQKVEKIIKRKGSIEDLNKITIESCGKSRIPLNGLVEELHLANLQKLYSDMLQHEMI
jgi:cyclase